MEKRFKSLKQITIDESNGFISAKEDFRNNFITFYTLSPSTDKEYPSNEGWEDINYFTKRPKHSSPQGGKGTQSVYILSNKSMPGLLKIGYTGKDINIRINDLSKATGVPTKFKLEYLYKCNNGVNLETELHIYLKEYRANNYREFFEIELKSAIEAINKIGKNHI